MRRSLAVPAVLLLAHLAAPDAAWAKPSWAADNLNSCREGCHDSVEMGRMEVTAADTTLDLGTQLDGKMRGALQTFDVMAGTTVTLSVDVLDGTNDFAVQLKRLETPGQLNDVSNFLVWMQDNTPANPWTLQENMLPGPYFTKDDGDDGGLPAQSAGVFSFDLFIDAATPVDVYDLEFAVAGKHGDTLWYGDEHFYVRVPEPDRGVGTAAALMGILALRRTGRRGNAGPQRRA